jgi:hypothetical protein
MKIVQKRSQKEKFSRIIWFLVALLLLALVLMINQSRSGSLLPDNWIDIQRSLRLGNSENGLPVLAIDMAYAEYDQILGQREEALSSGVVMASNQDFVPADMQYGDETIPVFMRLQQGPALHLGEEEKWNFEVRTRNDQLLADMQRFYLIDPADNNWLNEWAFNEALRREGLVAGRYKFVRLFLNGDYQGIYALQEGFGSELIAGNDRPEGVLVEFDAEPLWETIAYFGGDYQSAVADPITNLNSADFQYFEVDTFRDAAIAADPVLSAQKDRAIGLLRGLQSGELPASEVFDVEKYGRFLALTDLWAATQGTSLVNLRYYFNPESGLLEPVGFNASPFGSPERVSMSASYHDPTLQTAYVLAAQRMAQPEYLAELADALQEEMEAQQQALAVESDQELSWDQLKQRQDEMNRSLCPLQPLFAYLGPPTFAQEGIIQIDVANVLNLPLEIIGFDIDGATFLQADPSWIQSGQEELIDNADGEIILRAHANAQSPVVSYVRFHLPISEILRWDDELDFMRDLDIQVATRLVGLDDVQMTSARPGYPDPLAGQLGSGSDQ